MIDEKTKLQRQIDFIRKELNTKGFITRNYCLRNYISCLAQRVHDLARKENIKIHAGLIKYDFGKDYIYFTEEYANLKKTQLAILNGKLMPRY